MQSKSIPKYLLTIPELAAVTGEDTDVLIEDLGRERLLLLSGNRFGVPAEEVKEYLLAKGISYSFQTIVFANMKGGVGKTTSAVSMASRAAQYGFRTCILDMDSQGSASFFFDMMPEDDDFIFSDIWQNPQDKTMEALKKVDHNLYLLPSSLDNGLLDLNLIKPASQKNAVHDVCGVLRDNGFDLVIVDCPPSLGTAVISSICAADTLIIPVCSDAFSRKGLQLVLSEAKSICETFNMSMPRVRVLFTRFDRRTEMAAKAIMDLAEEYGENLFSTPIRTTTEFSKVLQKNETIFAHLRKSNAKEDYDRFTRHLLGLDIFNNRKVQIVKNLQLEKNC